MLVGSNDYAFVRVGEFGYVVSYSPEMADAGTEVNLSFYADFHVIKLATKAS